MAPSQRQLAPGHALVTCDLLRATRGQLRVTRDLALVAGDLVRLTHGLGVVARDLQLQARDQERLTRDHERRFHHRFQALTESAPAITDFDGVAVMSLERQMSCLKLDPNHGMETHRHDAEEPDPDHRSVEHHHPHGDRHDEPGGDHPAACELAHLAQCPSGVRALTTEQRHKQKRLTQDQATGLPGLSQEISSSTTWTTDFGQYAPSQSMLVSMITGVGQLATEATAALDWSTYVNDEYAVCSTSLLEQVDTVGSILEGALKANPGLAKTYPQLITFLAARSRIAKKAAATRKQNQKTKEKEAAGTASTTGPAAAASTVVSTAVVGH